MTLAASGGIVGPFVKTQPLSIFSAEGMFWNGSVNENGEVLSEEPQLMFSDLQLYPGEPDVGSEDHCPRNQRFVGIKLRLNRRAFHIGFRGCPTAKDGNPVSRNQRTIRRRDDPKLRLNLLGSEKAFSQGPILLIRLTGCSCGGQSTVKRSSELLQ